MQAIPYENYTKKFKNWSQPEYTVGQPRPHPAKSILSGRTGSIEPKNTPLSAVLWQNMSRTPRLPSTPAGVPARSTRRRWVFSFPIGNGGCRTSFGRCGMSGGSCFFRSTSTLCGLENSFSSWPTANRSMPRLRGGSGPGPRRAIPAMSSTWRGSVSSTLSRHTEDQVTPLPARLQKQNQTAYIGWRKIKIQSGAMKEKLPSVRVVCDRKTQEHNIPKG